MNLISFGVARHVSIEAFDNCSKKMSGVVLGFVFVRVSNVSSGPSEGISYWGGAEMRCERSE